MSTVVAKYIGSQKVVESKLRAREEVPSDGDDVEWLVQDVWFVAFPCQFQVQMQHLQSGRAGTSPLSWACSTARLGEHRNDAAPKGISNDEVQRKLKMISVAIKLRRRLV